MKALKVIYHPQANADSFSTVQDFLDAIGGIVDTENGDVLLPSGGAVNFNSGDVTITHSANALAFAGATGGYSFDDDLLLVEGAAVNWDSGDVTLTQSGNSLTVAGGNLIFPGTATNDSAAASQVGEYISAAVASASAVSLSTDVVVNLASISLTAGDWDVAAIANFSSGATTSITRTTASLSQTSVTFDASPGAYSQVITAADVPGSTVSARTASLPSLRKSLSGTTTIYLAVSATFTVSTLTAWGQLSARRVR